MINLIERSKILKRMNWIETLFFKDSIAHSILIVALAIALGLILGKIKIKGISLGVTWILFAGIILSHFGMLLSPDVLVFVKDFGLILFVYAVGMQVGPGFFQAFKKGGLAMNLLAVCNVLLAGVVAVVIMRTSGEDVATMVGVMSGAITNTPGLGAAIETYSSMNGGAAEPVIGMSYAVAYPLGVIGLILSILFMKTVFRVNLDKEKEVLEKAAGCKESANIIAVELVNQSLYGKTIYEISHLIPFSLVVSRLYHSDGKMEIPSSSSVVEEGAKMLLVASKTDEDAIIAFLGKKIEMKMEEWEKLDTQLISKRLVVTKSEINGKTLAELNIRSQYGLNITRINRAGVDVFAAPNLALQVGDRVTVVGNEQAISKLASKLGNAIDRLKEPNLIPIFLGIFLGVVLGSLPIFIPGIPQPVKLGLAGGPLIIAILVARFGYKYKMVTYSTISANRMLKEVGISLFLAAVGLGAGNGFVETVLNGGYIWILYGFLITTVPLWITATIARFAFKLDFFSIIGMLSGSHTQPIALSYSTNTFKVSQSAVSFATVYPVSMFMRVLVAQLLVLLFF